jgi:hypothetical protein
MRIPVQGFGGANRAREAKLIPEGIGADSVNQKPGRGDLRAWRIPLAVATVPAGRQTIYRMGRDVASDVNYWLSWPTVVHAVRGFDADDPTERTYYTGDGAPKVTDNVLALASPPYPTAARTLGVPAPTQQPIVTVDTPGTGTAAERFYVYTFVTDKGEESAPSPVSAAVLCNPNATLDITNLGGPPAGNYGITLQRIYRTQTGTSGATTFFFLREIAIGVTATEDDARALGEEIATTTWSTPPANLKHLTGMWNGMMAGISGRSVRFSEPFSPYAWPPAYEFLPVDVTPVALAAYQQVLVALTTGRPYRLQGTDPASMQDEAVELDQACVSERSVQAFGHGVVYASPDGVAYVGTAGPPRVMTAPFMTREDWQALNPSSIVAGQYEGLYLASYTDAGGLKGFLIDSVDPQGIYFLSSGQAAYHSDRLQDALYTLSGTTIGKWDAGASFMTVRFRTKVFHQPRACNMGAAEVVAEAFPVTFRMWRSRRDPVTGITSMVLAKERTVTSREPFTLPAGYLADQYQFEIEAAAGIAVQGFTVAETVDELKDL